MNQSAASTSITSARHMQSYALYALNLRLDACPF
jgi:hypothetical protein